MVLCPVASGFKQKIKVFKTEEGGVKRGIFSGVFGSDNPIWKSFRRVEVSPHGDAPELYRKAMEYRKQRNLGFAHSGSPFMVIMFRNISPELFGLQR